MLSKVISYLVLRYQCVFIKLLCTNKYRWLRHTADAAKSENCDANENHATFFPKHEMSQDGGDHWTAEYNHGHVHR